MIYDKISLTPKEILEKEFSIDTRGFRPQEVDQFLDIVIKDYQKFESIIKQKDFELKEMFEENLNLKRENRILKDNVDIVKNTDTKTTNVDIIRRLSQLEKIIYGDEK
ncbi:MAG: DivIVA domain-containing protein [Bacilli bacterium]|jgi:DivIVA domain-containing protein|nr:DivIVA domain-containing protein [Mollicutes bacterium]